MPRILFEKTGRAVWISHLDLMRVFQRSFKRAGLRLTHTQGFNPRPTVSIALPLSVGVASRCELLDFDLDGEAPALSEIQTRLNNALVEGVRILEIYDGGRKLRDISLLSCAVTLVYDAGVSEEGIESITGLFDRDELLVEKKSKNGPVEQDIIPLIRDIKVCRKDADTVELSALICCQNPSMNPMQLAQAVNRYLPEFKPDHSTCMRIELYDDTGKIFR